MLASNAAWRCAGVIFSSSAAVMILDAICDEQPPNDPRRERCHNRNSAGRYRAQYKVSDVNPCRPDRLGGSLTDRFELRQGAPAPLIGSPTGIRYSTA